MPQKRQNVLAKGPKADIGDLRTFVAQLSPRLLPSVEFGQIHCLIVVVEGEQQHPTWHRPGLLAFQFAALAMSPVVLVFGRRQRRDAPHAQLAGVQKAPRHEVAGSWAPAKQRAL
jgi:hypothetical protein